MIDWGRCPSVGCMLIMFGRTRMKLVPFALAATGALMLVLAGCRKEEEKPAVPPSSPQSYMNDEAFMGKLEGKRKERASTMARHAKAWAAYQEALKADPKGEKPETKELLKKAEEIRHEYEAQRAEAMKIVRERLTPVRKEGSSNKGISK